MPSLSEMVSAFIAMLMSLVLSHFGAHDSRGTDQAPVAPATQNSDRSAASPAPPAESPDKTAHGSGHETSRREA